MSKKTDLELVQDVRGGNTESFGELVDRHERFLKKVILRMTRDPELTEDIVQESLIKAFRRLGLFEGRSSFRSWMYQITVNTARNRFRKMNREVLPDQPVDSAVNAGVEEHVMALDVRALLIKEIERLPERQKEALQLRIYEDLSFKEIADLMNCPYDTAKANYRHALMKLKSRLEYNHSLKNWTRQPVLSAFQVGFIQMEVEGQ